MLFLSFNVKVQFNYNTKYKNPNKVNAKVRR